MARKGGRRDDRMRERLVQEAARIMAEEGLTDYHLAKRKAAQRLGASETRNLPQNREIQAALADYQRLFGGEQRDRRLAELLDTAIDALGFLERFRPRLVGSLIDGTAGPFSEVNIHVFAETPEEVVVFLMENDIPYDEDERRYRFEEDYGFRPVFRFMAGDVSVSLAVFDDRDRRHPPRSRVDGMPMRRVALVEVQRMRERLIEQAGLATNAG